MRVHAVFNRDGGTFRTMDMEEYCRSAKSVFADAGTDFTCEIVEGKEIERALKVAAGKEKLDAILAGGGDGTISAAAGICWREGMPLGVVPAGTMNLFARSLQLPLDVHEVLTVLAQGSIKNADIATANGRPYIHQYSVGLHSRMVRLRNSYKFKSRWGKMRASVHAAVQAMLDPPVFDAVATIDGKGEHFRTSAISVANNHFGADPLLFAESLSGGELGIYIAGAMRPAGVAKLVFDILRGKLKESPAVTEFGARRLNLHFPKMPRKAKAVMDGELLPLERDVEIELHAGELKILAAETSALGDPPPTGRPSRKSS